MKFEFRPLIQHLNLLMLIRGNSSYKASYNKARNESTNSWKVPNNDHHQDSYSRTFYSILHKYSSCKCRLILLVLDSWEHLSRRNHMGREKKLQTALVCRHWQLPGEIHFGTYHYSMPAIQYAPYMFISSHFKDVTLLCRRSCIYFAADLPAILL